MRERVEEGVTVRLLSCPLMERAASLARGGRLGEAEEILASIVAIDPTNVDALDLLAKVRVQRGNAEKARETWEIALRLQPSNPAFRKALDGCSGGTRSVGKRIFRRKAAFACSFLLILSIAGYGVFALGGREQFAKRDAASGTSGNDMRQPVSVELSFRGIAGGSAGDGGYLGSLPLAVSRSGGTIRASGAVPSLYVRYRIENLLMTVPGAEVVDLRNLALGKCYTVMEGDTLWGIARKLYGSPIFWKDIADMNHLKNPHLVPVGSRLSLP